MNTHCLNVVREEARTQGGFELVGKVFLPQAQFAVAAVSKRVQQAAVSTGKKINKTAQRAIRFVRTRQKVLEMRNRRAAFTCDDGSVVLAAGHLTDTPPPEVLYGPRQPRLKDERPVAELAELTQTKREHVIL